MEYDKSLIERWAGMRYCTDYMDKKGALADHVSHEKFRRIQKEYFDMVDERIRYCKKILKERKNKDAFVLYTIAELYDRCNEDAAIDYLLKKPVRYYAIRSIRLNRNFAPAWFLLGSTYGWLAMLGECGNKIPELQVNFNFNLSMRIKNSFMDNSIYNSGRQIYNIERAIYYARRAVRLDLANENYQKMLSSLYRQRNNGYGELEEPE